MQAFEAPSLGQLLGEAWLLLSVFLSQFQVDRSCCVPATLGGGRPGSARPRAPPGAGPAPPPDSWSAPKPTPIAFFLQPANEANEYLPGSGAQHPSSSSAVTYCPVTFKNTPTTATTATTPTIPWTIKPPPGIGPMMFQRMNHGSRPRQRYANDRRSTHSLQVEGQVEGQLHGRS